MKFKDLVKLNNFLFVFDHRNENLPDAFQSYFHTSNEHQNHTTTRVQKMLIVVPMKKNLDLWMKLCHFSVYFCMEQNS